MQSTGGMPVARQSALDKARADAKAKRLRDEKEAASALEEFVKEFEAELSDEEHHHHQRGSRSQEWRTGGVEGGMQHSSSAGVGAKITMPGARGGAGGGARRHFTTAPREVLKPLPLLFSCFVLSLFEGGGNVLIIFCSRSLDCIPGVAKREIWILFWKR
jgi:hypothetical protein